MTFNDLWWPLGSLLQSRDVFLRNLLFSQWFDSFRVECFTFLETCDAQHVILLLFYQKVVLKKVQTICILPRKLTCRPDCEPTLTNYVLVHIYKSSMYIEWIVTLHLWLLLPSAYLSKHILFPAFQGISISGLNYI